MARSFFSSPGERFLDRSMARSRICDAEITWPDSDAGGVKEGSQGSPAGDPWNEYPYCLQAPRQRCKRGSTEQIPETLWHPCRGPISGKPRFPVSFVDPRLPSVSPPASSGRYQQCLLPILVFLALLVACDPQPATTNSAPERTVLASMQVSAAKADVHATPSPASPVVTSYPAGEQVSVYSQRDGWSEVSYGAGNGSGWIRSEDLQSPAQSASTANGQSSAGGIAKPSVRFLVPPDPVTNSHATGVIILEGSVSSEGRIFEIRTVENTTGSAELERQNREQLQKAVFAPVIVGGRPTPFVYDYRVQY